MKQHEFRIMIQATKEKVWDILWSNTTYPKWTAPFCEGQRIETDWQKGSKVHFVGPDGGGMVSLISEKIPHEFISFEHRGIVQDGEEDFTSEQATQWQGSLEYYRLTPLDDKTELVVDMDIADSHRDYFLNTWPKALQRVKELAEDK